MAAESGFDPLFDALEGCMFGRVQSFRVPHNVSTNEQPTVFKWLQRKINPTRNVSTQPSSACSPFVEPRHETMATKVVHYAEQHQNAILLLSAGENQFGINFSNASDSIRRRTVVCLHQPPSWLRLNWRDFSCLNGLGAIICLSHEQMEFISGVSTSPTILARHGVRHDFFRPAYPSLANSLPRLLFVGQWLRDFDTLVAAMELIWGNLPETRLDCVVMRGAWSHPALVKLARDQRVRLHADISPEALRSLYQQSSLLFLPLIDSVANNAIVEALAAGLPVVSTKVGGVTEYVPDAAGELCAPGDVNAHAEAVLRWLPNRKRLREAGSAGRKFAETNLDWRHIAHNLIFELQQLSFFRST